MKSIYLTSLFGVLILSSCCTLSFSNVLTNGTASDVVDDTQSVKSDPNVSPNLNVPVKAL